MKITDSVKFSMLALALPLAAQTDITTTINQTQSLAIVRVAIPSPTMGPSTAEAGTTPATFEVVPRAIAVFVPAPDIEAPPT